MAAVRLCAAALVRRGWVGALVVGLLVGLVGGAVLAAIAGARRTDSAYPRLLDESEAGDVQVVPVSIEPIDLDEVADLPQVGRAAILYAFTITELTELGNPDIASAPAAFASADGVLYYELEKPRILEGRLPDEESTEEVAVNRAMAEALDLSVGDSLERTLVDTARLFELLEEGGEEAVAEALDDVVTPLDLEVVGITRGEGDIIPVEGQTTNDQVMVLSPAFADRYRDQRAADSISVLLRDPDDREEFEAEVRDRNDDAVIEFPSKEGKLETVSRSVRPYSGALLAFAIVAAVTAFLVLGQVIARQVALDAAEAPTLRAVGLSTAQLVEILSARAVLAALVGGVVAVVLASAASPLFPWGPADLAEPAPGFDLDATVLGLGFAAIVALVVARAAVTAWLLARAGAMARPRRPSAVADRVARAGAPPPAVAGVRLALQGGAGPIGPVTTVLGLVAAVTVIVGVLAFGASLERVTSTPHLYGWNWDVLLEGYGGSVDDIERDAGNDDELLEVTAGTRTTVRLDQQDLLAFAFEDGEGRLRPTIVDGRRPSEPDEVALGKRSMEDLDVGIGDTIEAEGSDGRSSLRVVGQAVLPVLTLGETLGLSEGAVLSLGGLAELEPDLPPSFLVADLAPGAGIDEVRDRYDEEAAVSAAAPPSELLSYDRVSGTPLLLAALLAALGGGVLAHAIVTAVRRRRRDLAVLKTVGFVRPQVSATVACQALTLAVVAVIVGIPLGVVAGRWAWTLFAGQLGVVSEPVVSVVALVAAPLVAFGLANLVAFPPGWSAARSAPARVLRAE